MKRKSKPKEKLPFMSYDPETRILIYKKKIPNRWLSIYKTPKKHEEIIRYEDPKNKIIKEYKKIVNFKGKIILDAGCGTGRQTFQYAKIAKKVYALDLSKEQVAFIKNKIKKNKIRNIEPLFGRIEKIPLKSNSVDIVVGTFSVTSTMTDRKKAMKEILRVLKPKGKVILADSYHEGEFLDIWRKYSDPDIAGGCYNCYIQTKEMHKFKTKIINTEWVFPTVKKAADLFGYVIGGETRKYLLKNKKKRIKMKVYICYGVK